MSTPLARHPWESQRTEDTIFRARTAQFRKQECKIARELELRLDADLTYMDERVALMSIAKDAKQRFLEADLAVKKHVLSMVLSNCSFRDRKVMATYRKPFNIIAEKLPRSAVAATIGGAKIAQNAKWLRWIAARSDAKGQGCSDRPRFFARYQAGGRPMPGPPRQPAGRRGDAGGAEQPLPPMP